MVVEDRLGYVHSPVSKVSGSSFLPTNDRARVSPAVPVAGGAARA
jgi:hypothetical protein